MSSHYEPEKRRYEKRQGINPAKHGKCLIRCIDYVVEKEPGSIAQAKACIQEYFKQKEVTVKNTASSMKGLVKHEPTLSERYDHPKIILRPRYKEQDRNPFKKSTDMRI